MVLETLETWEVVLLIEVVLVFFVVGTTVILFWLNRLRWPWRVTILEDIAGSGYQVTKRDRARLISFGDSGEEIFFLKKNKKYRIGYGKRVGRKSIAWAIGDDGYWYNVIFGDVNKKLQELGVVPIDRDMRFSSASLRKGIENRYNQKGFFEKWGTTIAISMLIMAMLVQSGGMWFVLDKQAEISANNAGAVEASKDVLVETGKIISAINTIREGGSGIESAT